MTLAWHFVGATLRGGAPIPADGVTLRHGGPLVLCESGFHASQRLLDALTYAPGNTICRVCLGGKVLHDNDKSVAAERTILWRVNGEALLCQFARKCALDVAHLWKMPPIVRDYLETGDDAKRNVAWDAANSATWAAARTAAWDVASAAAWHAASAAACGAARGAARGAVSAATWHATWHAAMAVASAAARAAVRAAQNRRLTTMVVAECRRGA